MKIITVVFAICIGFSAHAQSPTQTFASLEASLAKIPGPDNQRFTKAMERDGMTVFLYIPKGQDDQKPHSRAEVYVVISGQGTFFDGKGRTKFKAGDLLFVPAKVEHHFEDFSSDLKVWAVFYGPEMK